MIPNQYVDADNPYFIIENNVALTFTGGKIVRNTEDTIYYEPSTQLDGTPYTNVSTNYAIICPSVCKKLDSAISYRYWAIDLRPSGYFRYYCEAVAKIGGMALGNDFDTLHYQDAGSDDIIRSHGNELVSDSGHSIYQVAGRLNREFQLSYKNITMDVKNLIVDMFEAVMRNNVPIWYAPDGDADVNAVYLCDYIGNSLSVTIEYRDDSQDSGESFGVYSVSFRLKERK
jgi:hypothetical protein